MLKIVIHSVQKAQLVKDDLVREIHGVLDAYIEKANYVYCHKQTVCHVLLSCEGSTEFRTTYPRPHFHQPPVDLEREHGFKGIAGNYKLPEGLKASELQGYGEILRHAAQAGELSVDEMNEKFDEVLLSLAARNPQLAKLNPGDDWLGRYNIVLGVASEFNVKDIQFFLDTFPDIAPKDDQGHYARLWENIRGLPLIWMPAPDTLISIATQMQGRAIEQKLLPKWNAG